ncbi:hypothetical protein RQP46_008433 [Phenoliferia psychrophenolica]
MEQHGRDARDFDDADYDEYGPDLSDRKPSGSGSHRKGGGGHGQAKVALPRGSACTVCRKRKLKCGGERPSCNTCLRLSHDCSYGDPVHSRLIERTEELEDKIRLLESELEAHRSMAAATPAPQHHLPPIFPTYNTSHPGPHPSSAFPHLQTHHPDSAPPLHSHVAPHFVYGHTSIFFLTTHTHLPFINQPRFLYALRNPSTLSRTPSVCFLFALLAISAPYHSNPAVRSRAVWWYERARERVQVAINSGVSDRSHGKVNLTIETIQALALLTMIEMGKSDHQRAFLSLGQAVRIAAMLGLHRMDEDRIAERTGVPCALFCLDRFEAGAVGWPIALSESDIRILLPCADFLYEDGTCNSHANPLWWPIAPDSIENEPERQGPISSFAWLCRVLWLGGRICFESYRPAGSPFAGPFASENACSQMDDVTKVLQMDHALDAVRHQLNSLATVRPGKSVVNGPILMCLIVLNCLYVNLHHLRVATGLGLSTLPFNPNAPIVPGSPEYSMQRCLEGIHSTYEIVCQLSSFENMRTSTHLSRVTTFTSFVPYVLYCVAFPAKFCIGDWQLLANDRSRSEGITGRVQRGTSSQDALPSGDDVFGPGLDQDRLALIDALCNAMDRIGVVWDVGVKFAAMVRGDRYKLQERAITRQESYHSPHDDPNSPSQHSHHSQHSHGSYGP